MVSLDLGARDGDRHRVVVLCGEPDVADTAGYRGDMILAGSCA